MPCLFRVDAAAFGLAHFAMGRRALGTLDAEPFNMRALHPFDAQIALKPARDLFMLAEVVAEIEGAHVLEVGR